MTISFLNKNSNSKDYFFLKNLYRLLDKGYGIEETLLICRDITHHPVIDEMFIKLFEGQDMISIIKESNLNKDFLEYFYFFSKSHTLSTSIKNSMTVCESIIDTKNKLRKQLTYPLILISFLFFFSLFVLLILFPKVNSLFLSFSIEKSLLFEIIFFFIRLIPICILLTFITFIISFAYIVYGLKKKKFRIIDKYLKIPFIGQLLKKYLTLKFAIYFNELLKEDTDTNEIICLLNDMMIQSDIKILIYDIYLKINEGETFIDIIDHYEYFDSLFTTMYRIYLQTPEKSLYMNEYIDISYQQIQNYIQTFIKYFVPSVYLFVAFFVISMYVAIIMPMMNIMGEI